MRFESGCEMLLEPNPTRTADQKNTLALANYVIELGHRTSELPSVMKVVGILFYAHGWSLFNYNDSLLTEKFQAWENGPMLRSVFDEFAVFGNDSIERNADVPDIEIKQRDSSILDSVWYGDEWGYGKVRGMQLFTTLTAAGTPWYSVFKQNENAIVNGETVFIENDAIRPYFSQLAAKRGKA